ncbi:MFS transporter [Actinoplanes sp. Pm04-4]|uniref:MFS transporter n=1 Tax=Paractinoplanes pyxinae TaxID=2997416 RepID=A0ABT4B560_9ACTN|nr:MFS transporter [Actinoplanes pyxinae]MCY1141639.1 MFS transporter [Actinoplanes pyxinae]
MAAEPSVGGHRLDGSRAPAIVAALAVTQTVGYGTLYYAFAVFLVPLAADLNASTTAITGSFTANVLASAALAIPIGRWLDRHGGRALMTAGSVGGAVMLVAWSQVDSLWQLYAVQLGIGLASAACLYEAVFVVIIAWHSAQRRSTALLALTVVAGFASTIFLPLTGWLVEHHGWRTTLLILATIQAVLTIPLHAMVIRAAPSAHHAQPDATAHRQPERLKAVLTDRGFWLLTVSFTAHTAAIAAAGVLLVAALINWGHSAAFAATTAGLFGVLSVTGRLVTTGLQRRYRTTSVVATIFMLQGVSAAALAIVGRDAVAAVIAVIGFGLGFGVGSIAKPFLLAERYDTRRYATIAGILVVPMTIAKATAPLAAAALHTINDGYGAVFLAVAGACAIASTALASVPSTTRDRTTRRSKELRDTERGSE